MTRRVALSVSRNDARALVQIDAVAAAGTVQCVSGRVSRGDERGNGCGSTCFLSEGFSEVDCSCGVGC